MLDVYILFVALAAAPLNPIVKDLGDNKHPVREQASRRLEGLLPADCPRSLVPVVRLYLRHPDLEVRRRVQRALDLHECRVLSRLVSTHFKPIPQIDMLPSDYPDRRQVINDALETAGNCPSDRCEPDWTRYRRATSLYIRKLYEEGKEPQEIIALLDRMVQKEIVYLSQVSQERVALANLRPDSSLRLPLYANQARRWFQNNARPWTGVARLVSD